MMNVFTSPGNRAMCLMVGCWLSQLPAPSSQLHDLGTFWRQKSAKRHSIEEGADPSGPDGWGAWGRPEGALGPGPGPSQPHIMMVLLVDRSYCVCALGTRL